MWNSLGEWLNQQLKERNLSAKQASEMAGLSHSAISKFMRGTIPTVESCQKLAHFFGVPDKLVLELAGYFPPEDVDAFIREVSYLAGQIPESHRPLVLALLRKSAELERKARGETEE